MNNDLYDLYRPSALEDADAAIAEAQDELAETVETVETTSLDNIVLDDEIPF